jgi:hypothetical protein
MLSREEKIRRGSTAALDEPANPDNPDRAVEVLTEAQVRARETEKAQLIALALAGQGGDTGPRARRGKPDELRGSDYEEQGAAFVDRVLAQEPVEPEGAEGHPGEVVHHVADENDFTRVVDELAALRKANEEDKVAAKKAFGIAEARLLAERDRVQRDLERARQAEARRGLSGQLAGLRAQAASEIPAEPMDRRSEYHRKIIVQIEAALVAVRDTQAGLTQFARTTLPSLKQIAALSENDVPVSWQQHHRARLLALAETAAKVAGEHRGFTDQCAGVVRRAELLLAQEFIDGEDADVRTKVNVLLREMGYAGNNVMEHLVPRADSLVSGFAQTRKDGDEFSRKSDGTIYITLDPPKKDPGRDALRKGRHRDFAERDPKPQPGPLDSLGIDTSRPPVI